MVYVDCALFCYFFMAMQQQKKEIFSLMDQANSWKHFSAIKKIQSIIYTYLDTMPGNEKNDITAAPPVPDHSSLRTQGGLLLAVTNLGLKEIYSPWGLVGLPIVSDYRCCFTPIEALKESGIILDRMEEKYLFDDPPDLYPILKVGDIELPRATKKELVSSFDENTLKTLAASWQEMEALH